MLIKLINRAGMPENIFKINGVLKLQSRFKAKGKVLNFT